LRGGFLTDGSEEQLGADKLRKREDSVLLAERFEPAGETCGEETASISAGKPRCRRPIAVYSNRLLGWPTTNLERPRKVQPFSPLGLYV
jgi:hypothetical protein